MNKNNGRLHLVLPAIIALVVSLIVSIAVVRTATIPSKQLESRKSVYDEVTSRGVIRAGYYIGAPYLMKDTKTGKISGIFAEALENIASKLNMKVEWTEEVGFGQMIEGLKARRYDVIGSGVWLNAGRGKQADFTVPLLYDAVSVFVRGDDRRFDNNDVSVINNKTTRISTIDGEMAATIAKLRFPLAQRVELPQMTDFTQMILNVTTGKADVTFLGMGAANAYLNKNPNKIHNPWPHQPISVFPTAFLLPADQYQFKQMLDSAIIEMLNNGEIETIIRKYEQFPNSHMRVARPYEH